MQEVVHIDRLPDAALDAASEFTVRWLPNIRQQLAAAQSLVIMLPPAARDHADWRRAAVRDLARAYAPVRVNITSGGTPQAQSAALSYLESAAGITGQYLPLADEPLESGR